jgi:peptidoglycan/xylan/chitin deacetylase (PgdA/CDA1 family)
VSPVPRNGLRLSAALGLLAALTSCGRQTPPPVPPPAATTQDHPLAPWAWHRLGGLLVVVGEVDQPTDLVLKGRYLNERMFAEFGPVRWEMYAPPAGEIAELRTVDGKVLARWDFDAPLPKAPEPPKVVRKPKATPLLPKVVKKVAPPPHKTNPGAIVQNLPPTFFLPPEPVQPLLKPPPARLKAPPHTPWPDTHLPLVQGLKRKPAPLPKPAPEPPKVATVTPVPRPPVATPIPVPKPVPLNRPEPPPPLAPLPVPAGPVKDWPGAGEALNLIRGPRGSHWVCMTFDGGSTAEVALEVLDALKERGIRTTFFLTGAFIQKYPDLVRRMDHDGHEIGNHTMDHPHLAPGGRRDPRWTKERFQQQLLLADALLLRLLGRPMDPYWRAPYGEQTTELRKWAEELGYRHVFWSEGADTLDWATTKERKLYRTGNVILDRLYTRMERDDGDGLIVLMHLGSGRPEGDRPARVLGPFLDKALEEGWNFVNISAYLQESGKPHWNSSHRLAMLAGASPSGAAVGQTAPRQ